MLSILRVGGYGDDNLGAIVPHQANLTVPTGGGGGGGLGPLGGGGGGSIPPGEQSVAGSGGAGSALNPIGRTTIIYVPGVGQRGTFQPTAQGSRVTMGTGGLATTMQPMGVSGQYPTGGLYSRRMMGLTQPWDAPGLSGLDGFFGDVGNFFGKAIRYVPAAFVAPFAPASFTKRVFGLTPRESKGYEIGAKTARGVAAAVATVAGGYYLYGLHAANAPLMVSGMPAAAPLAPGALPPIVGQGALAAKIAASPSGMALAGTSNLAAMSAPAVASTGHVAWAAGALAGPAPLAAAPWYAGAGAALLTGAKYVGGTLLVGKVLEGLRAVPGMAPAPQESGGGGGGTNINVEAAPPIFIPVSSGGGGGGGGGEAPVEPEFKLAGMNLPTLLIVGGLGVTVLVTAMRGRK